MQAAGAGAEIIQVLFCRAFWQNRRRRSASPCNRVCNAHHRAKI